MNVDRPVAASAILAVGVTLGGLFIGVGFARGRATDRYVEVKGVAERDVTDAFANAYGGERQAQVRYIITQTIMVRSPKVDVVMAASAKVGELVSAGVVLSSGRMGYGPSGPTFLFTKLNELKPSMIREATGNARQAAEQFAADSRSALGGIRQANQGVFLILPRDQAQGVTQETQLLKTVRVVSTVQYYLKG